LSKGLASVKTLTAKQIADKWKLPLNVVAKKIAAGVKVEKEHTTSTRQANEIARDHLGERPDYYDKLDKMEKTKVVKENTTVTAGIGGLGFNTGTPAIAADNAYTDTNSISYEDWNGAILKMIKDKHHNHLIDMGFTSYSPNDIQTNANRVIKEAKHPLQANFDKYRKGKLNELGEYDNKGGMPGYEGTSEPIRAIRKRDVKEQSPANPSYKERPMYERSTGKIPADMSNAAERGIYEDDDMVKDLDNKFFNKDLTMADIHRRREVADGTSYKDVATRLRTGTPKGLINLDRNARIDEISAKLVGKVSNARFRRGEAPSKTLTRAINKKYAESGKKKEQKQVKEEDNTKPDVNLMGNQKPDAYGYGAKGTTKTIHEETKMDNKELINEALDCILEDNLPEMKDNLMKALQEKAMEKLEERKKEIAANYFAQ